MRGQLKGLTGGHSGDDINKKRANAIKLLGRFLFQTMNRYEGVRLAQFHSGKLHNAIPRDGMFVIAVPNAVKENVKADWNVFAAQVEDEFHVTDTQMVWTMESTDAEPVIDAQVARNFVWALQAVDNGIYAICQDPALNGMVETSPTLPPSIHSEIGDQHSLFPALERDVEPRQYVCNHRGHLPAGRCRGMVVDGYPAWKMRAESKLRDTVVDCYKGALRQGARGARHSRRTGVRTLL